ncbi:DMT family transporter [Haemophilus influenzae]|uniref:DMT family transporter n=1 Tax=Haemophilus influenzae TaxID=727 RepID=UPI000D00CD52|nr:DMT family transporter [Haemophilus influenzae]AWP53682.1 EamA/RhaT family transporter [Haemophilus influenzae]PRI37173.1 EamA-like transporter family protein [Haemophilus influenzae]PRJ53916.1 EamA-like transporter family protein [Haemophilus influenzae]PRJ56258.1 EamA-like transporter family protein [Haemophilus influenzae]PRM06467.1 EamA-like transporter family protein [Haemophilus influenzae]
MQSHSTPSLYHKAISFMVSAYFSITLMNVFVKTASQTIPASETLFSRFLIGLLFLLPFVIKDRDFKVDTRQWKFLILRNAAGVSSMLINFYVVKFLPLSIAVLLMNTSALFIPILLLFFHQKTPLNVLLCSLIGFLGVSIILLTNHNGNVNPIYVLIGLSGAVLAGMAFIGLQELNKYNTPKNIVFYFHLIGTFMLPIFFINQWKIPNLYELGLLLLVGGFGLIFQLLLTRAFKYAPVNIITPFAFTGVIFSSVFDWLFWHHTPNLYFWLGAVIIVGAVSLLAKLKK